MTEETHIVPGGAVALPAGLPMAAEIAIAILHVMGKVKKLDKDAEVTAGRRFSYTSVDQFFELLGPLMSEAGIFTILHEVLSEVAEKTVVDDYGKTKISNWMTTVYEIWIYHKSGAIYGPVTRKIQVIASGPQSYGMGPSYVEKYFLRSLFKVPTGDDDADDHPKTGLPAERQAPQQQRRDEPRREEQQRRPDDSPDDAKQAALAFVDRARKAWLEKKHKGEMAEWWKLAQEARSAYFPDITTPLYAAFKDEFKSIGEKLPPAPAATGSTTVNGTPAGAPATAEKKADDIPGFDGKPRPSESAIRIEFGRALSKCMTREECNDVYVKQILPHEKTLSKEFVDEMYKALQQQISQIPDGA